MDQAAPDMMEKLSNALEFLMKEKEENGEDLLEEDHVCEHGHHHHQKSNLSMVLQSDTWFQVQTLKRILCQRMPESELPTEIQGDIDDVLRNDLAHRCLTATSDIQPQWVIPGVVPNSNRPLPTISLWRGDITTLTEVTAIVNAANSALLGCFQPDHRCIDNVIHSVAGPRLRQACYEIMSAQQHPEPNGKAKVTPGFNLCADYILHTVGPSLHRGQRPSQKDRNDLKNCYISCLEAAENLPALSDGRKVVAFCCISTGLFAFPGDLAAQIATETVTEWLQQHGETTTLTNIIFDVYTEKDLTIYTQALAELEKNHAILPASKISNTGTLYQQPSPPSQTHIAKDNNWVTRQNASLISTARSWLADADYLIITAGAGLSAAVGLDYTSTEVFHKHYSNFEQYGLHRLYDTIGFRRWPSSLIKWSYYFNHMALLKSWPQPPNNLYQKLLTLTQSPRLASSDDQPQPRHQHRDPQRFFVRTSNADGFFAHHGFPPDRISTPQGQYAYLQCTLPCNRTTAVYDAQPFLDRALADMDPATRLLRHDSSIPHCELCGRELTLCVRGGNYFTDVKFKEQNRRFEEFVDHISHAPLVSSPSSSSPRPPSAVILELGVGLNTPGVIRWPNEDLVSSSPDGRFKLIRAGLEAAGKVPWDLEEERLAIGLEGDLNAVLALLLPA